MTLQRQAGTAVLAVALAVVLAVLAAVPASNALQWERCDLARTLTHKYQIPRDQLDSWMCIAWRESHFTTDHINIYNTDASKDYGIFQINNRWWCHNSESPQPDQNLCNVSCETLLTDMDAVVKCMKTMYAMNKNTWAPWNTYPYCLKEDMTQFTKDCEGLDGNGSST